MLCSKRCWHNPHTLSCNQHRTRVTSRKQNAFPYWLHTVFPIPPPSLRCTTIYHKIPVHDSTSDRDILFSTLTSFWNSKNLRDLLVHTTLTSTTTIEVLGNFLCSVSKCKSCPIRQITDTFTSSTTDERFTIKRHMYKSLIKHQVIYFLECRKCSLQYVGKTGQPLHLQMEQLSQKIWIPENGPPHTPGMLQVRYLN